MLKRETILQPDLDELLVEDRWARDYARTLLQQKG